MNIVFTITIAYLLGSIPFGLILTKMAGLGDIRSIGSGNIGATNVMRTGNKKIAALTLLLDGVKGLAAVLIIKQMFPNMEIYAGAFAVIGHIFPVWLKFKGGKGVVTSGGIAYGLAWPVGLAMMLTWIVVIKFGRVSSLAGLIAVGLMPVYAWIATMSLGYDGRLIVLFIFTGALVFWKHSDNIKRLLNGTEPKMIKKP